MSSANRWMAGSNGPSALKRVGSCREHGRDAQPTVRGFSARWGSARVGALGSTAGRKAPSVPGSGWALRWTLPSSLSSLGACRPGACARRASSCGRADGVRVHQDRHRLRDVLEREVVGRAEPGVVAADDDVLRRAAAPARAPPSSGPTSTTTSWAGAIVGSSRASSALRAVQHDDDGVARSRGGLGRSRRRAGGSSRGRRSAPPRGGARLAGASGSASAASIVLAAAPASPGRIEALGEDLLRAARGGRDDRPARRERLDQHHAVGLVVARSAAGRGAPARAAGTSSIGPAIVTFGPGVLAQPSFERAVVAGQRRSGDRDLEARACGGDLERELGPLPLDQRAEHERPRRTRRQRARAEAIEVDPGVQDGRRPRRTRPRSPARPPRRRSRCASTPPSPPRGSPARQQVVVHGEPRPALERAPPGPPARPTRPRTPVRSRRMSRASPRDPGDVRQPDLQRPLGDGRVRDAGRASAPRPAARPGTPRSADARSASPRRATPARPRRAPRNRTRRAASGAQHGNERRLSRP